MRGKPRKAAVNSVVLVHLPRYGVPFYGVIVDYRTEVKGPRYRIIETDKVGRHPRGPAVWREASEFTPMNRKSVTPGRIYRKNTAPEDRGCDCQCCVHVNGLEPEVDE